MFERVLRQMREGIRTRQYAMTLHGEEEMDEDKLSIFDVESAILTGEIIERQKEQTSGEWKYVLHGEAVEGDALIVVAKLGPTRKLIIITVYRS